MKLLLNANIVKIKWKVLMSHINQVSYFHICWSLDFALEAACVHKQLLCLVINAVIYIFVGRQGVGV